MGRLRENKVEPPPFFIPFFQKIVYTKVEVKMPANLPPQYFEKEKELKKAKTPQERVAILEELLAIVPKHKGTEKLQALLKTKIAKLKNQSQKKPAIARHTDTFQVEKTGAGQVVVIGSPNTGKSSLIKALTNANPDIGDYPFTTRIPSPAMMLYENIQIQLVDMPPITQDFFEFWQAELIKAADAALLVIDISLPDPAEDFLTLLAKLEEKRIALVAQTHTIPQDEQQFNKKTLIIANKADQPLAAENLDIIKGFIDPGFSPLPISISQENNLEELREQIYILLDVIRVYSKIPGKKVDHNDPYVFKEGSSLTDMAKAVHKDFAQKLKFARVWGKNKYQGQKVTRSYILEDEDIIELHI
jgi:ribosome-interacting GTPase 1